MNKCVFIGPSRQGFDIPDEITVFPPAQQGDLAGVVVQGAKTIILVDGYFTHTLAPWHKEILFALQKGCRVIGGGSLGALRALECSRYGMEAVGEIANWYAQGICYDDAEVALSHTCQEDGYRPLTVPLVNIRATAIELEKLGIVSSVEEVVDQFRTIHYTERSWKCMEIQKPALTMLLQANYIDQKSIDALLAIKKSFQPANIEADYAKNVENDYLIGLLTNDIRFQGEKRPWEQVSCDAEAINFWLMSEMAMELGLKVDSEQIAKSVKKCWENLGVFSEEEAKNWMKKHSVNDIQFNKFAIRKALIDAAKDWLNSVSRGRDFVSICYEYQLLTGIKK